MQDNSHITYDSRWTSNNTTTPMANTEFTSFGPTTNGMLIANVVVITKFSILDQCIEDLRKDTPDIQSVISKLLTLKYTL